MQTAGSGKIPITVELQDMFSYSPVGIIVVIAILVIALIFLIIYICKRLKGRKKETIEIREIKPDRLTQLKNKYNSILNDIEKRHYEGVITDRLAYQELSRVIRHFVHDVTGIKVQNYTLEEIGRANIPSLYYLIAECYKPEFDAEGSGNVYESINKARKVIEEWN